MAAPNGYLMLVLHAHLPFVRHPEYPEFLEETWLYEALTETYLPLLSLLQGLEKDGVTEACLSLTLSPPLCEMLADPLLQGRYAARLEHHLELAAKEIERTRGTPFEAAATHFRAHLLRCQGLYETVWKRDLIAGFRYFQDAGWLEIITCGATHGFLPLMLTEGAVRAQLRVARLNYRKHFGRDPRGIWLPECAYDAGLDECLRDEGLTFFYLDTHGAAFGNPRPRYGPYRPIYCPSGVAAFARDPESSKQVWSSVEGYPGDPHYREFYRDLAYDAEYEYIRPYLMGDGVRRDIGFKYHRITGNVPMHQKEPYDPAAAAERARVHADNFIANRKHQAQWLKDVLKVRPVIVSPYDAELFGHWWYEGPQFLAHVLRLGAAEPDLQWTTAPRFLDLRGRHQMVEPCASSWGDKGFYEVWVNPTNEWVYRHLHACEVHMVELARAYNNPSPLEERALNQAARELLLAQASDWAFIMTTGTMVAYAEKRTREHVSRFHGLYLQLTENRLEEPWLKELEWKDSIFPELDYRVYA